MGTRHQTGTVIRTVGGALERLWTGGRRVERVAVSVGTVLFVSGLVHLGILISSGGTWLGPLSMRKAVTFGLSFGLTLVTVAWATSFLRMRERARTLLLGAFTVVSVVETTLITLQVWRGVPSHFNFETGFDTTVSMSLAVGGGVIIMTAIGFTVAAMSGRGTTPALRPAIRFGFVSLLVALAAGAAMIATGVVEARGGQAQVAYDTAGFLKPLHFVAMHGLLVVPVIAWLLGFGAWTLRRQIRLVWTAIASYAALIVVVGIESAVGIPPLAAPWYLMLASLAAVAGLLGTAGLAIRSAAQGIRAGRNNRSAATVTSDHAASERTTVHI